MQFDTRKSRVTAVSLILMFAMAVSLIALPTATAQSTITSYPFINAVPNPVGINQEVLLHIGITAAKVGVASGWDGLSVTITKPDGTTETISGVRTDSTGGTGRVFVPTVAGNYTLQTHFPEQVYNNVVYKASDSAKLTLVVQEEPVPYYPGNPLPTEYWSRPIDSQLREWSVMAGSWLTTPPRLNYVADPGNDDAPETAHILWTKPFTSGGLVGGEYGLLGSGGQSVAFETGDAYQGKWSSRLIIAGVLIYTHHTAVRPLEYTAVDLRTGEELWTRTFLDNRSISMGQLFYWQSYNYQGTYAYLWVTVGSDWYAFDPFDGKLRLTIYNVPSGTTITGKNGEIYRYSISTTTDRMLLWNLSALISMDGSFRSPGPGTYNASATANASTTVLSTAAQRAYALNFTFPDFPGSVRLVKLGDRVVGSSISQQQVITWAFNLEPGKEGQFLFNTTWQAPSEWAAGNQSIGYNTGSLEEGEKAMALWSGQTWKYWGFSTETGEYLWETDPEIYLNFYGLVSERPPYMAYGNLYSTGVGGILYCYDLETGKTVWTYEATDPYTEFLFSNNWWLRILFFADGKIYCGTAEHSGNQPLPRGGPFVCLNATSGELIWRANGLFRQTHWGGRAIIGDSIIATMDTYSQRIYGIGKGPSATTVAASPKVSVHGSSVLVEGMVTDVSPGTEEYARTSRFPNGVPAVSDESMSDWMLYVYKQFARPANATGVEVILEVLDSNNNFYEVGKATSDASGFFSYAFTPEVSGKYTIFASFAGSGAYFGSFAETAVNVEEAPAATPAPTPTPAPMTDTYILGSTVGIIIAIVVVGLLLVLLLRKRP